MQTTAKRAALVKAMNGIMSRNFMPSKSLCDELIGMETEKNMEKLPVPLQSFQRYLLQKRSHK